MGSSILLKLSTPNLKKKPRHSGCESLGKLKVPNVSISNIGQLTKIEQSLTKSNNIESLSVLVHIKLTTFECLIIQSNGAGYWV
jgi:hypothetical protein